MGLDVQPSEVLLVHRIALLSLVGLCRSAEVVELVLLVVLCGGLLPLLRVGWPVRPSELWLRVMSF